MTSPFGATQHGLLHAYGSIYRRFLDSWQHAQLEASVSLVSSYHRGAGLATSVINSMQQTELGLLLGMEPAVQHFAVMQQMPSSLRSVSASFVSALVSCWPSERQPADSSH